MQKLDIISCQQDENTLVTRSLIEDFYSKSVLVVDESQEAIFYKDGQALDLFPSGRYPLDTNNLPLFKRFFAKLFNQERTPFPCAVIFINKASVLTLGFGTDSPIPVNDPVYNRAVRVDVNGQMGMRVVDSRKFIIKVVQQLQEFTAPEVKARTKHIIMGILRANISSAFKLNGASILDVDTQIPDLSDKTRELINQRLEEYGIELDNFFINAIVPNEGDFLSLQELKDKVSEMDLVGEAEQRQAMRQAQAEAYRQQQLGYTYQQQQTFDVLKTAAGNEATGGAIMNAGVGIGMGVGMAGQFGGMVNNMAQQSQQQAQPQPMGQPQQMAQPQQAPGMTCPQCGMAIPPGSKFCPGCGMKVEDMKPKAAFCPNCGTKVEPGAKFCPNCGNKLQ